MAARINWGVVVAVVVATIGWAVSGFGYVSRESRDMDRRISVVEAKQAADGARLERIETKLDRLLERPTR